MRTSYAQKIMTAAAALSDNLPVVAIQDFRPIGKEKFTVLFNTVKTRDGFNEAQYNEALASLTDGKLNIVADSLFRADDATAPTNLMRCIAFVNREVRPFKEDEKGLTKISANVLEDDRGTIWQIVTEGNDKHLVQVTKEDYSGLLAKRRQLQMVATVEDQLAFPYEDTDYVYYANPELEAMDFGFAVNMKGNNYVVSRTLKQPVLVEAHQIVEAVSTRGYGIDFNKTRREMLTASSSMQEYIKWLIELYGKGSEYVKAWERAIKNSPARVS